MTIKVTPLPEAEPRDRHVAIGVFDGVHLGHREVIDEAPTPSSPSIRTRSGDPPRGGAEADHALRGEARRDRGARGRRRWWSSPSTASSPRSPAEEFIEQVLIDRLGATRVSVGENFRFGAKAKGDPEMLARAIEFETRVVPLVEVDGETVSSTRIRALVAAGEVEARDALPRARRSCSRARSSRATSAGASSASRPPTSSPTTTACCPGHGVYAAFANGHPAAVNVGVRPTFETGRGLLIEAYLIDYEGDLYGQKLRVAFVSGCAASSASRASRSWSRRCTATSTRRARSALPSSGRLTAARALSSLPCDDAADQGQEEPS